MAHPPGISLAVIEAGRAFTAFGNDASMVAKVTPVFRAQGGAAMSRIIHEASGYPMVNAPDEFKAEAGSVVSFNVPHVDQPGWLSPSGDAYTMWYYAVEVTAHVGSGRNAKKYVWKQDVQPLVGQDFIDLDKIYDGPVGEPVSAPTATVTSVEGQTGAVVLGPIVGSAIDQAVAEGRIPHPIVSESAPGVYEIGEGGTVYGLTPNGDLPQSAIDGLDNRFASLDSEGRQPVRKGELIANVRDFGAKGDGTTDDTAALVAAGASGLTVLFPDGVYPINQTIDLSAGTVFKANTGGSGAWVQAGAAPTGNLRDYCRHIQVKGSHAGVDGLRFRNNPTTPLTLSTSIEGSTLYVYGGEGVTVAGAFIRNCRVVGLTGIMAKGAGTTDTTIERNWLEDAGGIFYAYAGAARTSVTRNVIIRAAGNGMTGHGSNTGTGHGCRLTENLVLSCTRMGVEDFGDLTGTVLSGNIIRNPGYMGMSLVGYKTTASGNTIRDFVTYGIETTGAGMVVANNHIGQESADLLHKHTGIIFNSLGHASNKRIGSVATGNVIESVDTGVAAAGTPGSLRVTDNTFYDPGNRAVSISTTDTTLRAQVLNNTVRFVSPLASTATSRAAFVFFSSSPDGSRIYTVSGNDVLWESTATSHATATEYIVKPDDSNIRVIGNTFHGGGILSGASMNQPPSLTSPGSVQAGLEVINNRFLGGATFNVSSYTSPVVRGNTEGVGAHFPVVVRAGTGQGTRDFEVWQDNAGTDLAKIDSLGSFHALHNDGGVYAKKLGLRNSAGGVAWHFTSNYGTGHTAFTLRKGDNGKRWLLVNGDGTGATPANTFLIQPEEVPALGASYTGTAPKLGFFDKATATVVKPTVTGSLADGTATASLLTALSALGLVTDSTTA